MLYSGNRGASRNWPSNGTFANTYFPNDRESNRGIKYGSIDKTRSPIGAGGILPPESRIVDGTCILLLRLPLGNAGERDRKHEGRKGVTLEDRADRKEELSDFTGAAIKASDTMWGAMGDGRRKIERL